MILKVKRPKLTQYQKDILYCEARFTITEASTKVGKTFSHIWWIYERAHQPWNKEGYEHWWVAPTYQQSLIAFKRLSRKVGRYPDQYKINKGFNTITCPNGAVISFKTSDNPNNLYGEDVYSVVYDEAPRGKVDSYYALRSTITATHGEMKLIGNYGGISNWVHLLKEKVKTDKNYKYFKITAWDGVEAGILDEDEIRQAQRDLPPRVFKQLYLAEEQESEDMLVTYDSINDLWTNAKGNNSNRYMTCDIAFLGSDRMVVMVWEGFDIIDYFESDKTEPSEVERIIKTLAEKHRVGRSNIAYDGDGIGSFLQSYLKGAYSFHNGGRPLSIKGQTPNYRNLKSQCGYGIAKRINNREVSIQTDKIPQKEFISDLECLQSYQLDRDGKIQLLPKEKMKEMLGRSPDILDALIMREVFELKPKNFRRVRT